MNFEIKYRLIKGSAIILFIVAVLVYVNNFSKSDISKTPADWGVFGDYIGGVMNPVISFLNLLVTVYIAKMINDFSKNENTKQVLIQNRIIKTQLMHEALNDFRKEINFQFQKIHDETINSQMIRYYIDQTIQTIDSFHKSYEHLFPTNKKFGDRLINDLNDAKQKLTDRDTIRANFSRQLNVSISDILLPLNNSKDSLLSNLNKEIVIQLDESLIFSRL